MTSTDTASQLLSHATATAGYCLMRPAADRAMELPLCCARLASIHRLGRLVDREHVSLISTRRVTPAQSQRCGACKKALTVQLLKRPKVNGSHLRIHCLVVFTSSSPVGFRNPKVTGYGHCLKGHRKVALKATPTAQSTPRPLLPCCVDPYAVFAEVHRAHRTAGLERLARGLGRVLAQGHTARSAVCPWAVKHTK
jgi:hypothetical protein